MGTVTTGTVPRALLALVDDAGLFPPTALPMDRAVARHRADAAAASPMLSGRFLCPASRLAELQAALPDGEPIDVGVIADAGLPALAQPLALAVADPRLRVRSVDVAVPDAAGVASAVDAAAHLPGGTTVWVEVARGAGWLDAVGALAAAPGVGAKLRCGGISADAFPTPDEVADFIVACVGAGVPFKATAGLHAAVRGVDPDDGLVHHGFLNLLVAAARGAAGAGRGDVLDAVWATVPAGLAAEVRQLTDDAAVAARAAFTSYGSCSTAAPVAEAAALGLLP